MVNGKKNENGDITPLDFIKGIEQNATSLVGIINEIRSNVDFVNLPQKLKSKIEDYEKKVNTYEGLLRQRSTIDDFYDELKTNFGIKESISFEEGMVRIALDYQDNIHAIATSLAKITDVVKLKEGTFSINGKIVPREHYTEKASDIVLLVEDSYKKLKKMVKNMHPSDNDGYNDIGEYRDNAFKQHLSKILVGGTIIAAMVGAAFGGWYYQNNYGQKEKIVYKQCGDCSSSTLDHGALITDLGDLIDKKNKALLNKINPEEKKEETEEEIIKEVKVATETKDNVDKSKITEKQLSDLIGVSVMPESKIRFSELYKSQLIIDQDTETLFSLENISDCQNPPSILEKNIDATLTCVDSLCQINFPEMEPGEYKLTLSCDDKNVPGLDGKISKDYVIGMISPSDEFHAEEIVKGKLIMRGNHTYNARLGSHFEGEFKLITTDLDYEPKLLTETILVTGGILNIKKKMNDKNIWVDNTYVINSTQPMADRKIKYPHIREIEICFEDLTKQVCHQSYLKIKRARGMTAK